MTTSTRVLAVVARRRWWCLAAYVGARLAAVDLTPQRWYDTPEYDVLDLTGGARRPWTVPLLYRLVEEPGERVVAQAVLGALAWAYLAAAVTARLRRPAVRVGTGAVLLALGLTTQVTSYDSTLLADSLASTGSVALVAAWIRFADRPTGRRAAAVAALTLLWTFVREVNLYLGALVLAVAAVAALRARLRPPWPALLAALAAIGAYGFVADARNTETADFNVAAVVAHRILPDPDRLAWFEDHGFPAGVADRLGSRPSIDAVLEDPTAGAWVRGAGMATYHRFLLTHPGYVLSGPLGDVFEARTPSLLDPVPKPVMLSPADSYGTGRPVLPSVLDDLLFEPGRTGAVTAAVLVALVGTALGAAAGFDRRWTVPLLVLALSVPHLLLVWHGATFEHDRHAMPFAVTVRVATIALLAVLVDRVRRPGFAPGETGRGGSMRYTYVTEHLEGDPVEGRILALDMDGSAAYELDMRDPSAGWARFFVEAPTDAILLDEAEVQRLVGSAGLPPGAT